MEGLVADADCHSIMQPTLSSFPWRYQLVILEQPIHSRMCGVGERVDRRPIDPPPIVQLKILGNDCSEAMNRLHAISPHIFLAAMLTPANELSEGSSQSKIDTTFHNKLTIGSNVSSMHMLRGLDGKEGAYFVFPDMSVRDEGIYRLNMCLFEIQQSSVTFLQSSLSDSFAVYSAKKFPGMHMSCALACHFAEQGLKIRIRKESRKRSAAQKFRRVDESTSGMNHKLVQQQETDEDYNMEDISQLDMTMMGMVGQRVPVSNVESGFLVSSEKTSSGVSEKLPVSSDMLHKVAPSDHRIYNLGTHASQPPPASAHWSTNAWHAAPDLEKRLPGIRIATTTTTTMDRPDHHYIPSITVLPNPTQMNDAHESWKSVHWHQRPQQPPQDPYLQWGNEVQSKEVSEDHSTTMVYGAKQQHPPTGQDMPPMLPSLREQLKSIGVSSSFQTTRSR
ncbi:predicted protein [Lichtheimia corymbifera JMRC:FSU:9682]|uniref:Velvet domain-containing protein n=1 Tax=Lichtheimia corymbifera JMRC:FSU:9682 TaxID=1263082 RepID=A0A068S767_9FUNG|nr:predicted protein [Lichtheimia corymbifera JMRC:FSU:9682]